MSCLEVNLPSIAAIIVSIAAVWISFLQNSIAKAKLQHDLYEKRYEVFNITWKFVSDPTSQHLQRKSEFTNLIPEASFLFGKDIEDYMWLITRNSIELNSLNRQHADANLNQHVNINRMNELEKWFEDEITNEGVKTKFRKYLDFSKWKD